MTNSLFLDGRARKRGNSLRYLAVINGEEYWLRQKEFTYLVKLAMGRFLEPDGSVSAHDLEPPNFMNAVKFVYSLRKGLNGSGLSVVNICRKERYRLDLDSSAIAFDVGRMRQFPDASIRVYF